MTFHTTRAASTASSRVVTGLPNEPISAVSASGVGLPTSGSPVVDMTEVSVASLSRVVDGELLGDHPAHRDAEHVHPVEAQVVDQAGRIGGHVGERVGRLGPFAGEEGGHARRPCRSRP